MTNNESQLKKFSATRLAKLMDERGLTMFGLALKLQGEATDSAVRAWRIGKSVPSANNLAALAAALEVDIHDLYE